MIQHLEDLAKMIAALSGAGAKHSRVYYLLAAAYSTAAGAPPHAQVGPYRPATIAAARAMLSSGAALLAAAMRSGAALTAASEMAPRPGAP